MDVCDTPAGPQLVSGVLCTLFGTCLHFSNCNILRTHKHTHGVLQEKRHYCCCCHVRQINKSGRDHNIKGPLFDLFRQASLEVWMDGCVCASTFEVASVLLHSSLPGVSIAQAIGGSFCISIYLSCFNMLVRWSNASIAHCTV